MKIVSFGATGGTGKNVVDRALTAGHEVLAVARKPETVAPRPGLGVQQGDVLDLYAVKRAVAGADAVICTVGPASNGNPGTLLSHGVKNLVRACTDEGVRRLVFESGLMVSDGKDLSMIGSFAVMIFRAMYPKLYEDKLLAETTIRGSTLDWVIVRPPTLKHAPATGQCVAGPQARVSVMKALPHADCADVLLRATTEHAWVRQIVNVGVA